MLVSQVLGVYHRTASIYSEAYGLIIKLRDKVTKIYGRPRAVSSLVILIAFWGGYDL